MSCQRNFATFYNNIQRRHWTIIQFQVDSLCTNAHLAEDFISVMIISRNFVDSSNNVAAPDQLPPSLRPLSLCLSSLFTFHRYKTPPAQPPVSSPRPLVPRLGSEEKWNFDEVSHVSSYCISSLHCHCTLFRFNIIFSFLASCLIRHNNCPVPTDF